MKKNQRLYLTEVMIETPKGSVQKYHYDSERRLLKLKKLLPAGMAFPYDFGFIPGTKGQDGDPLDIIVISPFCSFPGCVMDCRIIGLMEAKQSSDKGNIRNDRYLAVPSESMIYSNMSSIEEFPKALVEELENFFVNYNAAEGKKFKVLRVLSAKKAADKLQLTRSAS